MPDLRSPRHAFFSQSSGLLARCRRVTEIMRSVLSLSASRQNSRPGREAYARIQHQFWRGYVGIDMGASA